MSSLMTNASAMTALKTLQMTNKSLDQTENRISTGYKVATASDNAAYWSIATTMRSDNKALSTVQDALGLGAATVDVAYTAMDSVKDVLDQIKTKLVSASQPGVDKSKIQSDISELQKQLETYANSASFSGNNWLSVNTSSSSYKATQSVVSSFNRSSDNQVSISTIDIDITGISLFNTDTTAGATGGLLDAGPALTNVGGLTEATSTAGAALSVTFGSAFTMDADDSISFQVAVDAGTAKTVTINKGTVEAALTGVAGYTAGSGTIADATAYKAVLDKALSDAGVTGMTTAVAGSAVTLTSDTATTGTVGISNLKSSQSVGIMGIDITNATADQLKAYTDVVETMSGKVTTAAANLGSVKSRIDMQQDFVKNLMDAVDRGVGALVDADMSQESTRLQALQTQQQLGIQALSIANSNSQSILSLFR